jgi:hypothetical protein
MNTLIIGSGEYVTGYTYIGAGEEEGEESPSDKSMGVVGLVFFDLRQRGLIGSQIAICITNDNKFVGVRDHWNNTAKKTFYNSFGDDTHPSAMDFTQFPKQGTYVTFETQIQIQIQNSPRQKQTKNCKKLYYRKQKNMCKDNVYCVQTKPKQKTKKVLKITWLIKRQSTNSVNPVIYA